MQTSIGTVGVTSRLLLTRVSYVTSLIMRDLTSRGVPSFGSFQLLRLYVDEVVHMVLEDALYQATWPAYAQGSGGVRAMHPMLFMFYEAVGAIVPPMPPMALPITATAGPTVAATAGVPLWFLPAPAPAFAFSARP